MREAVFSCNFFGRCLWKARVIICQTGPVLYEVQDSNGVENLHASQLRGRYPNIKHPSEEYEINRDIKGAFSQLK